MRAARHRSGVWCWSDRQSDVEVCFGGKGTTGELAADCASLLPSGVAPAWLRQIHSERVIAASPGLSGEGDALLTCDRGLGLVIVTADCVPVLLAGERTLAAVHAGWRGIAARIIAKTLARFSEEPSSLLAWIGPSIGPCCYEVGEDVASQVVAASHPGIARTGAHARPHLDLAAAVRAQLAGHGVRQIRQLDDCTRCQEDRLWSYRRDGKTAGRNLALIWRRPVNP